MGKRCEMKKRKERKVGLKRIYRRKQIDTGKLTIKKSDCCFLQTFGTNTMPSVAAVQTITTIDMSAR